MIIISKIKKTISLFLILVLSICFCNSYVYGDDLLSLDGLILSNDNKIQFLSVNGAIYETYIENNDVKEFCNIIANSGMKVNISATEKDKDTLNILGLTTAKKLSGNLQEKWESYQKNTYGVYSQLKGRVTKKDDTFSFVTEDKIYSPMRFEYTDVKYFSELVANTGIEVNIECAVHNDNSMLVSYIHSDEKLPTNEQKMWEDYVQKQIEKKTKKGVIISHGSDSYMLIENETNKMYYLRTEDEIVYMTVPIVADRGIQVSIIGTEQNNVITVNGLTTSELPKDIQDEIKDADKKRLESKLFYIDGYVTLDGSDYNIHYDDGKKLGIESNIEDVVKVIKAVANDKEVLLRFEGYINYEQTVMDVRNVTFLVDLTEGETLKKLQEAFPDTETVKKDTDTGAFAGNNNSATLNNGLFGNNTNDAFSSFFSNINSQNNSMFNNFYNNSNFSNMYNNLFGNNQNNTGNNNFSSLFGNSSFSGMSDMFASFNSSLQNQSSLLNGGNFNNFNFEDFQSAFNSFYSQNANLNNKEQKEN